MNRTLVIAIVAVVIAIAALATYEYTRVTVAVTHTPTKTVVKDTPLPPGLQGKEVTANVYLTKKFFQPNNITVNRFDTVDLYVAPLAPNLTILVTSDGRRFTLGNVAQLVVLKPVTNITLICAEGCDAGVTLHVNVQ